MALKNVLSYADLKTKIGCQNIFNHYFGEFTIGTSYHSPLRKDNRKSAGFFINNEGYIIFKDFGEDKTYNFIDFVAKLYNISQKAAIQHIAATFGLIKDTTITEFVKIKSFKEQKKKQKSIFSVKTRNFSKKDLSYWKQYEITKQELIDNTIYSVESFSINNYTIYTKKDQLRFAYLMKDEQENGYFKIYTPEDKERKWVFNANLNLVYGLEKLECKTDTLIITKSVKDYIVLKKFFPDVIAVQNEGKGSLDKKTIKVLQKCFSKIYIFFDLDRAGVKAIQYYKKNYDFIPLLMSTQKNIWKDLIFAKQNNIKDPSDFIKKYGIENFKKWINQYYEIK